MSAFKYNFCFSSTLDAAIGQSDCANLNTTFVSLQHSTALKVSSSYPYLNTTFVSLQQTVATAKDLVGKFKYNFCFSSTIVSEVRTKITVTFKYNFCFSSTKHKRCN